MYLSNSPLRPKIACSPLAAASYAMSATRLPSGLTPESKSETVIYSGSVFFFPFL